MTKYRAGDKVKIKTWDKMVEEFGLDDEGGIDCFCGFVPFMDDLCGKELVIEAVYSEQAYYALHNYTFDDYTPSPDKFVYIMRGEEWIFSDQMFVE